MVIEKLRKDDLDGLRLVYEEAFELSDSNRERMAEMFERIKDDPDYHILCAKIDGRVVGSVMGVICYELIGGCFPFMVIENVAVLKDFRRMGVAEQLMNEQEKIARALQCSLILLVSSEHRTGAHKLYESLGYDLDKVRGFRKRLH